MRETHGFTGDPFFPYVLKLIDSCDIEKKRLPLMRQPLFNMWKPRKTQTSALRSLDKMLIYNSKLRFCLSRKP